MKHDNSLMKQVTALLGDVDPKDEKQVKKLFVDIEILVMGANQKELESTCICFFAHSILSEYLIPCMEMSKIINHEKNPISKDSTSPPEHRDK